MRSIPNSIFEKTYVLFSQFNTKFGEYIIAKFIEATILGSLVTVGLLIVGFPYPFILGFIGVKLVLHAMHENELPFINGGQHIEWAPEISTVTSLLVIVASMAVATIASVIKMRSAEPTSHTK